jgi:hypothetical protein
VADVAGKPSNPFEENISRILSCRIPVVLQCFALDHRSGKATHMESPGLAGLFPVSVWKIDESCAGPLL